MNGRQPPARPDGMGAFERTITVEAPAQQPVAQSMTLPPLLVEGSAPGGRQIPWLLILLVGGAVAYGIYRYGKEEGRRRGPFDDE